MSTIWIQKFRNGLDARRLPETTESGALIRATNGHTTRGGEFEKRAAFVPVYSLPVGTVSLAATASSIYVFGSATEPVGMPSGVLYQRLQNLDDALVRVVSRDLFSGNIYSVGVFSSGDIAHYYNGVAVNRGGNAASVAISVNSGAPGATVDVLVDGVSATVGPVAWAGSVSATATAIVAAINANTSSPDYVAHKSQFIPELFSISAAVEGTDANGRAVTFTKTGVIDITAFFHYGRRRRPLRAKHPLRPHDQHENVHAIRP
jgi:hypothetical protein